MKRELANLEINRCRKQVESRKLYAMEVCPLATHNNALSCKDVTGVTEVLRSSLADPEHVVRHAWGFAEKFSHISNAAISDFISKIVCQSNERSVELSVSSQITTRTEPSIAEQDNYDNCACQEGEGSFKKSGFFCRDKLCTHWLDFIIVLMAAAGVADHGKTGGKSEDKYVPAEHDEPKEKTASYFKSFSLRIWRKGMKSAGLLKDRTAAPVKFEDNDSSSKGNIVSTCESKEKENKEQIKMKEIQNTTQDYSAKCTKTIISDALAESSSSGLDAPPGDATGHERANQITTDTTRVTQQQRPPQRRKLPNQKDGLLRPYPADERPGWTGGHYTTLVKEVKGEKEELRKEAHALKSQIEMLIKENRNFEASLAKEQTEKQDMTQKCDELEAQLHEHEQISRQHKFMLKSRLERLQHAKLAADQGCLHLSLRLERLAVYEQQATLICQRMTDTIKRELEETHSLFGIAGGKCSDSMEDLTWDNYPVESDGLALYEAHYKLENYLVELNKRYRALIQLLTENGDEDEKLRGDHESLGCLLATIEEGQDATESSYHIEDDYQKHSKYNKPCAVKLHHAVSDHDSRGHEILNIKNTFKVEQLQGRGTSSKYKKKSDSRTRKSAGKHCICRGQEGDKLKKEETKSLRDLPSSSGSLASEVKQYPRRSSSLNTIDSDRGQRSCSSIVALVRFGQRSGDMAAGVECSACRRNKQQNKRVQKSMSTCRSRSRMSRVHYV